MSTDRKLPRLINLFGTGTARCATSPPPKRIAPRQGDPVQDARFHERVQLAHDHDTMKGHTMAKYQMALDAAPQDGRWLDDPNAVTTVLQFLLSKLPPDQLAELDDHLTKGTTPQATDHRLPEGDLKCDLLKYTPRNRRAMVGALAGAPGMPMSMDEVARRDPDYGKSFEERFGPNATRFRG